jgi:DNA modification methylase
MMNKRAFMNTLYFGDNLEVLREKIEDKTIEDKSVDLIYLKLPFH